VKLGGTKRSCSGCDAWIEKTKDKSDLQGKKTLGRGEAGLFLWIRDVGGGFLQKLVLKKKNLEVKEKSSKRQGLLRELVGECVPQEGGRYLTTTTEAE